jgi:hypothetical protein
MTPDTSNDKERHSQLQPALSMADPSFFDPLRIPTQTLATLDWRPFHFTLQPYHYLVRMVHIIAMGAFFGGIGLLDFRLMGWRGTVPLRGFAEHVLPWLWVTFGITGRGDPAAQRLHRRSASAVGSASEGRRASPAAVGDRRGARWCVPRGRSTERTRPVRARRPGGPLIGGHPASADLFHSHARAGAVVAAMSARQPKTTPA